MKILIIEDNLDMCNIYRDMVEDIGSAISVCHTVEKALYALLQFQPDIVLLDLELPKTPAETILSFIRSYPKFSDIGVIVISDDSQLASYTARRWEANAWFKKPVCREELYDVLRVAKSVH